MKSFVGLIAAVLATWRLTALLVYEEGPLDLFARLRTLAGVGYNEFSQPVASNVVAKALLCHRCTSVWVGGLVAIISLRELTARAILYGLALSAGSIFVQERSQRE